MLSTAGDLTLRRWQRPDRSYYSCAIAGRIAAEAADGAEAVPRATRSRPDVVLMDIRMPVMDARR